MNNLSDTDQSLRFIACGMYAFTDELQLAWQKLFDAYHGEAKLIELQQALRFESAEQTLRDPRLFFGHTCGYPLMKSLQHELVPICVPIFNAAGSEGKFYSSHFIVGVDSDIESLSDCYQRIAATNTSDSNSGMNLLRHAIAPLSNARRPPKACSIN